MDGINEQRPPYGYHEDSSMGYAWLDDPMLDWQKALRRNLGDRDKARRERWDKEMEGNRFHVLQGNFVG